MVIRKLYAQLIELLINTHGRDKNTLVLSVHNSSPTYVNVAQNIRKLINTMNLDKPCNVSTILRGLNR